MKHAARARKRPATRTKKVRDTRVEKLARHLSTPADKAVRDLIVQATRDITFVHAAIHTELIVQSDGFHVRIVTPHRETGDEITVDLHWDLPPYLLSREHAIS